MEKPHNIDELNRLYSDGETCDKELFSEQRSNILLSSGDHFTKKGVSLKDRMRDTKAVSDQKLRLVKNHTHKIIRTMINNIVSLAPGVTPLPVDEKDLRHIKSAELNKAVWEFAKSKHQLRLRTQGWAKDFVEIGEVFCKVYFDPNAGRFVGYEQEVDELGQPVFDEMGQPVASNNAQFTGDICFKTILPANVIRAAEAKTIEESRFLCIRDMVDVVDLKKMVGDDEDKLKLLTESDDKTFFVFDNKKGSYGQSRHQTMVREFYFRPCVQYPNGYFYITVEEGILFEGELPFGVFPIAYGGYDEIATTPRHRSIIKQLRPIQSEINRAASKMAEHQITIGDDKIILQNGSKVTTGPQLPGMRTMFVTGQAPTTMPGRTGDQYLPYLQASVSELYQVSNVDEDSAMKGSMEPWLQGFATMREKKKFSMYAEKFESFLVQVCEKYLELAKEYFDENMLIPAIGRAEYVNIAEFKNQDPLCTRIKVTPANDDLGSMMLKQLSINHTMQFVGNSIPKDAVGRLLKEMPFANFGDTFSDLTLDDDAATNIILALDRGEQIQPQPSDNADYILKRMSARQKKQDFQMLDPQIKQAYAMLMQAYEQAKADQAQKIKEAQAEFIPASGAMIKVDYYIPDPKNPSRSIRATLPAESIDWLIKQLSTQGSAQEQLAGQTAGVQSEIAQMIQARGPVERQLMPNAMPEGQPAPIQNQFLSQLTNPNIRG